MVASLQSIRLISSQMLLKALDDAAAENPSGTAETTASPGSGVLRAYGYDTSDGGTSSTNATLQRLLDSLSDGADASVAATEEATISDDITTKSFMAGLKQKLTSAGEGGSAQADAMLQALAQGTLTVTDAASGVQIAAWDVDAATEKDTVAKDATAIDNTGWSPFLKSHLTRGANAAYARTEDGSFVDKPSGQNAYFGTVGEEYVYLTWPKAG